MSLQERAQRARRNAWLQDASTIMRRINGLICGSTNPILRRIPLDLLCGMELFFISATGLSPINLRKRVLRANPCFIHYRWGEILAVSGFTAIAFYAVVFSGMLLFGLHISLVGWSAIATMCTVALAWSLFLGVLNYGLRYSPEHEINAETCFVMDKVRHDALYGTSLAD